MAAARATLGGSGEEQRRRSAEMITRWEGRGTRDAARKNLAENRFPEARRAGRLAALQESDAAAQRPGPARAATGKRDKQCPARWCAGERRRRHRRNTTGPRSPVSRALACRKSVLRYPSI